MKASAAVRLNILLTTVSFCREIRAVTFGSRRANSSMETTNNLQTARSSRFINYEFQIMNYELRNIF
ncbi:MAG TPA: hypothetical protein VF571_03980 [Pyrinomonadaceae bacterium]